jgi:hypothetical protein
MDFPKQVYVTIDQDKAGNDVVRSHVDLKQVTSVGKVVRVAVYRLVEVGKARGTVDYTKAG